MNAFVTARENNKISSPGWCTGFGLKDRGVLFPILILWLLLVLPSAPIADDYAHQREAMVREIEADVRATARYLDTEKLDDGVMAALRSVPRHAFVPDHQRSHAYANRPLPIGQGQTISQPYIVAIMTQLLGVQRGNRVLELGTGSGYQAAILAALGAQVFSMEIVPELAKRSSETLLRLGYDDVSVREGDGYHGWEEHAPFDAIVVTAAGDHIPPPLVRQLTPGGKMVIPVGGRFLTQQLVVVEKAEDGTVHTRNILPVRFVPLTGGH